MSSLKPITLHVHPGPNPWKIAILLRTLSLPYTTILHTTPQLKEPSFLAINPSGMSPVLEDPNTGLTIAESATIAEYILEQYDTPGHIISFADKADRYKMMQWIAAQSTAQGPLIQRIFRYMNTQPNPTARADSIAQFVDQVLRPLERELSSSPQSKDWLVGNKCSAADLCYLPFHVAIPRILGSDAPNMTKDFPLVDAWMKRVGAREDVKKVLAEQVEAQKAAGIVLTN